MISYFILSDLSGTIVVMSSQQILTPGKATICVVNFKTLDLMRLCLRSIRKYTQYPYEVLVIDNNSQDASVDYLRSLPWIRFIQQCPDTPDRGPEYSHGAALDLGIAHCSTEFFVSLHSDTIILNPLWLKSMIDRFTPCVACVGGGKLEPRPPWRRVLKAATDFKALQRNLFWNSDQRARYCFFIRTVCAAYRTEVIRKQRLSFLYDYEHNLTVGHRLYRDLKENGYDTVAIPDRILQQSVTHLVHATQIINPDLLPIHKRVRRRSQRYIKQVWESEMIQDLLTDDSLDR